MGQANGWQWKSEGLFSIFILIFFFFGSSSSIRSFLFICFSISFNAICEYNGLLLLLTLSLSLHLPVPRHLLTHNLSRPHMYIYIVYEYAYNILYYIFFLLSNSSGVFFILASDREQCLFKTWIIGLAASRHLCWQAFVWCGYFGQYIRENRSKFCSRKMNGIWQCIERMPEWMCVFGAMRTRTLGPLAFGTSLK